MSDPSPRGSAAFLGGIFAPVPTPFRDGGETVDLDALCGNLERWMATRLAGVLVLGSNGEAPLLTERERDAIVETARRIVPADRTLLVGSGRASTAATIRATRRALEAGADAALVVTPSYYRDRMDGRALQEHYEAVAAAAGGPVLLYHVPAFTALELPVDTVLDLARRPGIAGIKDSSGEIDRLRRTAAEAPEGFAVLTGSAPILAASLTSGARGAIVAAACVAPDACCDLADACAAGRRGEAEALQERLTPLALAVTRRHGIPGLKALLDHLGWRGGPVRRPLRDLGEGERGELVRTWEEFTMATGTTA